MVKNLFFNTDASKEITTFLECPSPSVLED